MRATNKKVLSACAVVMAICAGCDTDVDDSGASSEATVCSTVGTTWWNQSFTEQTGTFHVEFAATPSRENIDAVVGLSSGPASTWTKLAAIVRFNPDGWIDARNGAAYTAVQGMRYGVATYYIRIDVDVRRHTYSAWVSTSQGNYGAWNQVAANYAFRTEQASVTRLNNLAAFVNPTFGGGSMQVCGFALNPSPPTGSDCVASNAGGGFLNVRTTPSGNSMIVDVSAAPSLSVMDGVVGISRGAADEYNDFAAAVRFYTNGRVEARDGDTYRADTPVSYAPGERFAFKFVIDLQNKTYSVYLHPENGQGEGEGVPRALALNYRFRPQQLGVTSLDNVSAVVSSSTGRVDLCNPRSVAPANLRYARPGNPHMTTTADGVIVSDGTSTQRLDMNGKILWTLAGGGMPAVDPSGNLYLARNDQATGTVTVDAFSPTRARKWTTQIGGVAYIEDLAGYTDINGGGARIAVKTNTDFGVRFMVLHHADGEQGISQRTFDPRTAAAVSSGGWANAVRLDAPAQGWRITWSGPLGHLTKDFTGDFEVTAIAIGPDGSIVFGGEYYTEIDFGAGPHYPLNSEDGAFNSFIVALAPNGAVRFSKNTAGNAVRDLDTDGNLIAVSNAKYTQSPWVDYGVYDTAGNALLDCGCEVGLGDKGYTQEIKIANRRVYVNSEAHLWWEPNRTYFDFMIAYDF